MFFQSKAQSAELYEGFVSARAAGMGNVHSMFVNGDDALFYNPAGLARSWGVNFTLMNVNGGANGLDVLDTATALTTAAGDDFTDAIRGLYGKKIWVGGKGKIGFSASGFGGAYFGNLNFFANAGNPAYPTISTNYIQDMGYALGYGLNVIPGVMQMGVAVKRITRTGGNLPIGLESLATLDAAAVQEEISATGVGVALDAGITIGLPVLATPMMSIVWKNIGTTRFTGEAGAVRPPNLENDLTVGFGLSFETFLFDIRPGIEFKHLTQIEEQFGKKVHIGAEFAIPLFAFRAGFSQGYYSLGAGMNMGFIRADIATYGVELGEYPGQHEDRRYMLELSMELGFGKGSSGISGGSSGSGESGSSGSSGSILGGGCGSGILGKKRRR
jgi:hypothetical protein